MSDENKTLTNAVRIVDTLLTAIRDMVDEEVVKRIEAIEQYEFDIKDHEEDIESIIRDYCANNIRVEVD